MTTNSGSHLTTSRISRLFRPLRAKCNALAITVHTSGPSRATAKTYMTSTRFASTRADTSVDDLPPVIIPPPQRLGTLARMDRPSRQDLPLSKAIYDVRDAYRNTLQVAFGGLAEVHKGDASESCPTARIRSLAAICASVIGEQVEDLSYASHEEKTEDEEDMEVLNALYEAVPPHYRRFTIATHALSLVLDTCPHHATLLYLLLEVNIAHGLLPQSETVLSALLHIAFQASTSSTPPRITHGAHSLFLTTLHDICCLSNSRASALSTRSFTRVFRNAICQVPARWQAEVWTSKAVRRLVRRLLASDFVAYADVMNSLLEQMLHDNTSTLPEIEIHAIGYENWLGRLSKWLEIAYGRLCHISRELGLSIEHIQALASLLEQARMLKGEHLPGLETSVTKHLLSASVVALAAPCFGAADEYTRSVFLDFIRSTPPQPMTFSGLVAVVSSVDPLAPATTLSFPVFSAALPTIRRWAAILEDQKCFLHEASLWSATLSHFEGLSSEIRAKPTIGSAHEFETLRTELIDLVETAERRSFGYRAPAYSPRPARTPRKVSQTTNEEWRWEEVFGCWVKKTPAQPRMKVVARHKRAGEEDERRTPVKRGRVGVIPREKDLSPLQLRRALDDSCIRGRRTLRAPSIHSSRTSTSLSPSPRQDSIAEVALSPNDSDSSMNENGLVTKVSTRRRRLQEPPRRVTIGSSQPIKFETFRDRKQRTFQTLVADALRNRIILHPQRAAGAARSQPQLALDVDNSDGDSEEVKGCIAAHASSDDALDLFAYMSSEH